MWVWASISPGRTVARERSITAAPSGIFADAESPTLSIRFPRTTITWLRRGAEDFPSMSVPARITVTASAARAGRIETVVARRKQTNARQSSERISVLLREIGENRTLSATEAQRRKSRNRRSGIRHVPWGRSRRHLPPRVRAGFVGAGG